MLYPHISCSRPRSVSLSILNPISIEIGLDFDTAYALGPTLGPHHITASYSDSSYNLDSTFGPEVDFDFGRVLDFELAPGIGSRLCSSLISFSRSPTVVNKIIHEYLSVRKLCSRWIPHNLTEAQKFRLVDWCCDMMQRFAGGDSNEYNIVAGDEKTVC
ncbi:hypothetical protein EVAR_36257_1 [Eumeta japonica]|uniref:Uncharacterized protein n=1 Tax=Eumeta variegata TaxID=151549 RepID=A0A4C1WZM3_EUMVA|nr:hypothetical protein EVAR_36257_1 [Eumeta japonica]